MGFNYDYDKVLSKQLNVLVHVHVQQDALHTLNWQWSGR